VNEPFGENSDSEWQDMIADERATPEEQSLPTTTPRPGLAGSRPHARIADREQISLHGATWRRPAPRSRI